MSVVQIYQFCRAFDNVRYSEVYGYYVSGGYAFEKIARASHEVPPEIREAVINDYFKLNDNYPPETGDFALIAREIDDKYSVLAVANRQLDDGGRPTIGYKYFWLDKSKLSQYVDGIGTLIHWWSNHKKPKPEFNMEESGGTSLPETFSYNQEYLKPTFQEHWLQETWNTVEKLQVIPRTSVATKELWQQEYPEYIKLHYLALGLSLRANYFNAWAWNVQKLENPKPFLAIFYATQEDIPNNILKEQLPSPQPQEKDNSNNFEPNSDNKITAPTQPKSTTGLPTKSFGQIPRVTEKKIKSCLASLGNRLDDHKIQELFGYLKDYADADWTNCIDRTTLRNASSNHDIYTQLIYLVAPNDKLSEKWLLDMIQSITIESSPTSGGQNLVDTARNWAKQWEDNNERTSISEFQKFLLKASYNYDDVKVREKLEHSIYYGISYLLIHLITNEQDSIIESRIGYLLTESQSIWSQYFQSYIDIVARVVLDKDKDHEDANNYPSIIDFCKIIIELIERIKQAREENKNYKKYINYKYKKLAVIFRKTKRKDLTELFYLMSGNTTIPQDVRNCLPDNIRSQIFGTPTNQGIFTPIYPTNNYINYNHSDRGDDLHKAILGFLFFLFGSFIFFNRIKDWTGISILVPITFLIFCSTIAIVFTGNPFKTRNINIRQIFSWIYMFLVVAFLVGGVYPFNTPTNDQPKTIYSSTPKPTHTSTGKKQCSLDTWENSKNCPGKLNSKLLEEESFTNLTSNQTNAIEKYLLSNNIRDDAEFKEKKQKALDCLAENIQSQTINDDKFSNCLKREE
jgi:hypothetical protein